MSRNQNFQARQRLVEARRRADEVLRAAKRRGRSPSQQIEQGLAGIGEAGPLAAEVCRLVRGQSARYRAALGSLLLTLADRRSPILADGALLEPLAAVAFWDHRWLRPPAGWQPQTHNPGRQFAALLRHLFARYDVPHWLDGAWRCLRGLPDRHCQWFLHVGGGQNLRTAPGLPFPLTKMMAHHALAAPDDLEPHAALRFGQVRGLGGSERLALAAAGCRLRSVQQDEPFWLTVLHFFTQNPMLDPRQVGPIVDFLHDQRFVRGPARIVAEWADVVDVAGEIPQPNLCMRGRTVDGLLRQVAQWHHELARRNAAAARTSAAQSRQVPDHWPPCGIPGYERIEGVAPNRRIFHVVELRTARALYDEGQAMRHCVGSYAYSCARGQCAIYSLRETRQGRGGGGTERRLSIEVIVQNRRVVQARGRLNRLPEGVDERVLRAWATTANLSIAPTNRM